MISRKFFQRSITSMASPTVSPFSQAVVAAMRKLYPEKLADSSFDNTGLLLEAPYRPGHLKDSALLTIDLTKAVADEAIRRKDSIIITYHPIIFRPLKSLTQSNTQQNSLLRLAQEGISVYSPHTAVDAAPGGLCDFLADITVGFDRYTQVATQSHTRSVITPVKEPPKGFEAAGYGRIVKFESPQNLGDIVKRITKKLGLSGVSVAVPQSYKTGQKSEIEISSIGICAGSGGSMLMGLDVDLLFTGELSHHEALAVVEQGKCVITTFHSNSERRFLEDVLHGQLVGVIATKVKEIVGLIEEGESAELQIPEIGISQVDRDPFEIVSSSSDTNW